MRRRQGGTLIFPHTLVRTQHLPFTPKKIRNFKHPPKKFEILATQKNIPILYLDRKKDPKLHRIDPQTSPILWWPQKISTKSSYPKKTFIFLKTPKNIKNQKNWPSLRMHGNFRVPPPTPWEWDNCFIQVPNVKLTCDLLSTATHLDCHIPI